MLISTDPPSQSADAKILPVVAFAISAIAIPFIAGASKKLGEVAVCKLTHSRC
jgi:hypothetical protein